MSNTGWKEVVLGDLLEIKYGKDHKKLKEGLIPCMGTGGVMRYVEKSIYDKTSILLPRKGSLNNIYYIDKPFWTVDTLFWSKINEELSNPRYLFYVLSDLDLASLNVGSAVPSLTVPVLNDLEINLPPLPTQKAIAKILGDLDAKIELNRKMNENLEAMAQALFQSWFVDFDPVLDNFLAKNEGNIETLPEPLRKKGALRLEVTKKNTPEINELFPSDFVFNEVLGKWIPEGWDNSTVGERYSVKGGHAFKSKDFKDNGIKIVKIKDIKSNRTVSIESLQFVAKDIALDKKDFLLNTGDLLMAMTGATVGKFGVLVKNENELVVLNQRVAKFYHRENSKNTIWFVYSFFNDKKNLDFIVNTAQGSAQPNISANEIMRAPMVLSNEEVLLKFETLVNENFNKMFENQKQAQSLTKLRYALLPQLISGKLSVPEAMLEVEEEIIN